jgi:cyclic pyranopterin phosphate synthase
MSGTVDISEKRIVRRIATACGKIRLKRETIARVLEGRVEKGDVIEDTKIVALTIVKKTSMILPYCHNIPIEWIGYSATVDEEGEFIEVCVTVKTTAKTGVEMEALCGVLAALANIWDMVKKYEKDEEGQYPNTLIYDVRVVRKRKEVQP